MGQKGLYAYSARLHSCQDRGACALLWEGKMSRGFLLVEFEEEERRLSNFLTAWGILCVQSPPLWEALSRPSLHPR